MGLLLGLILGSVVSYFTYDYLNKDAETIIRYQALNYILGMDKAEAKKWLDTKNPGCGLKKPSELNFVEMWEFINKIRK